MRIIVSSCLLGCNCKYNGGNNYNISLCEFLKNNNLEAVGICPEVFGGLPTPRISSEIKDGKVFLENGLDVTKEFTLGAVKSLNIATSNGCEFAILKAKSPSCGLGKIYDGTFSHTLKDGNGIACELFLQHNIKVFTENNYKDLLKYIK